jgi:hypothetical protein
VRLEALPDLASPGLHPCAKCFWKELVSEGVFALLAFDDESTRTRLAYKVLTFASSDWTEMQMRQLLLRAFRNEAARLQRGKDFRASGCRRLAGLGQRRMCPRLREVRFVPVVESRLNGIREDRYVRVEARRRVWLWGQNDSPVTIVQLRRTSGALHGLVQFIATFHPS